MRLLQDVGWYTLPAEQQHGSLAQLKRWHPGYEAQMLASRSLLLQIFRLLPKPSAEEKRVAILTRKLNKISTSNSWKTSGRQQFVKGLIAASKKRKDAGQEHFPGRHMKSVAQHWFARHAALWATQTLQRKAAWNKRAVAASIRKEAGLREEEEALISELEVLIAQTASVALGGVGPLSMSAASLTPRRLDPGGGVAGQWGVHITDHHQHSSRTGISNSPSLVRPIHEQIGEAHCLEAPTDATASLGQADRA